MLANGVTGYRQMSGSLEELQRREQRTNLAQPSCLAMPGAVLTMANARTPDMAIAEVRAQKEAGADFIKSVFVPREVFFAALTEATRQGLPFVGHLPPSVTPSEAAAAGMRAIEHLGPGPNYLLSCSGEEASLRAAMAPPAGGRPPALTPEVIVNPMLLTSPAEMNAYARLLDTFDQQKCEALARIFGDHEVWQTPTLIRLHTMAFGDAPTYQNDPNLRFADTSKRALWINAAERFATRFQQVDRAILGRLYQQQAHITALFAATNVKMLAGSDLGGQWLIPGFSLHQEFDKLAEAGVPPLHILQMATLNGAEFLGRSAAMGTVEVGKVADLVLLDADPVERADNLHRISAVVRAGALYSRGQLDEMLRASQQA